MIYLAGGIVIHEGISSDAREAGSFVGEMLFSNEEEAIKYANGVISDLTEESDKARIADYSDKEVKKTDDFQFDDVWVQYPDGEVVKVCVWVFDDPKPKQNTQRKGIYIQFEDENGMVNSAVFDGQEGNFLFTTNENIAKTALRRHYYPEYIKILKVSSVDEM